MICCENYEELGCLNSCEPLNLGIADENGTYTLLLEFNEVVTKYDVDFSIGDELIFEVVINENYKYVAKLISPSKDETCFKFTSKTFVQAFS